MAVTGEIIVLESNLVHKSEDENALCRKKKRWWKPEPKARGSLVRQSNGKYSVKVCLSPSNICTHVLPDPGKAIVLRHNVRDDWKSLCIVDIFPPSSASKANLTILVLSISDCDDFRKWEVELRKHLKVYSCEIEVANGQIVQGGPAIVHITSEYVYITTNDPRGKYKSLYCRSRRKNTITCNSNAADQMHCLEVKSRNGRNDAIKFKSKNVSVIKKSLHFFTNLATVNSAKTKQKRESTEGDAIKIRGYCESVPVVGETKTKSIFVPTDEQEAHLRYSNNCSIGEKEVNDRSSNAKVGFSKSTSPCLYSYRNVKCNDGCDKNIEETYIKEADFVNYESKIEYESKYGRANDNFGYKNQLSVKTSHVMHGERSPALKRDTLPSSESFLRNQNEISYDGTAKQLETEESWDVTDVIARGSNLPTPNLDSDPDISMSRDAPEVSSATNMNSEEVYMNEIEIYRCSDKPLVFCRPCQANDDSSRDDDSVDKTSKVGDLPPLRLREPFSELITAHSLPDGDISIYDQPQRSPNRRKSQLENWTPKSLYQTVAHQEHAQSLPPILKRDCSLSLHPLDHFYENANSLNAGDCTEHFIVNDPIGVLVHVFANEMACGGVWTIGVLILKTEDTETFKLVQKLENDFGRNQVATPRILDATSDIKISVKGCSKGFDVIGEISQVLGYADLKNLGARRWIVTEFQFSHSDEDESIFKCDLAIGPARMYKGSEKSHFSSQNISIIKKFSRSGSVESLRKLSPPPRSRLTMSTRDRQELCRDLDLPAPLGKNWKDLAGRIGLDMREIRIIEHSKCASYTEEVLQILENRHPEKCSVEYLKSLLVEMKRPDMLEYFEDQTEEVNFRL